MPDASNQDIVTARTFPLPREAVYSAFADPVTLARWWGPHGSMNTFETFELRAGGAWRFTMRAADGAEYHMVNEFVEVDAPRRIVVRHHQTDHGFTLAMTYEAVDARLTRVEWRMRFDTAEEAARVRAFVVEANEQNLDRLEAVLGLSPSHRVPASGPEIQQQ